MTGKTHLRCSRYLWSHAVRMFTQEKILPPSGNSSDNGGTSLSTYRGSSDESLQQTHLHRMLDLLIRPVMVFHERTHLPALQPCQKTQSANSHHYHSSIQNKHTLQWAHMQQYLHRARKHTKPLRIHTLNPLRPTLPMCQPLPLTIFSGPTSSSDT
jgi:hypothetical protein